MKLLFRWLTYSPLWLIHLIGTGLGWLVFLASKDYRQRFLQNAQQAGYPFSAVWPAVAHAGCMVAELPRLWMGRQPAYTSHGAEVLEAAIARSQSEKRGLLFLTPHLGCFEITAQALAGELDRLAGTSLTVLYRPAKQEWLREIMEENRKKPNLHTAPTNLGGVKQLMKALKQGHSVGLLPDQVPPLGMGVWSPFFGRSAYTMTLPAKLIEITKPIVLLTWAERLSLARGFAVHYQEVQLDATANAESLTAQINQVIEHVIRKLPQQYIWDYNRYKDPKPA